MEFIITALVENRCDRPELAGEFGLSMLIEANGRQILFDTGASGQFMANATTLGKDLTKLDAVVLSHGHYDHCCGLPALLRQGPLTAPLFLHRTFFTDRCWDMSNTEGYARSTSSGIDAAYLSRHTVDTRLLNLPTHQPFADLPLYIVGNVPRTCPFELMNSADMVRTGDGWRADDYGDELSLVLVGDDQVAVITGCAHNGMVNICTQAEKLFQRPVTTYIGGTHLFPSPMLRTTQTVEYVQQSAIETLAVCHCTGPDALAVFAQECPSYVPFQTGSVIRVTV